MKQHNGTKTARIRRVVWHYPCRDDSASSTEARLAGGHTAMGVGGLFVLGLLMNTNSIAEGASSAEFVGSAIAHRLHTYCVINEFRCHRAFKRAATICYRVPWDVFTIYRRNEKLIVSSRPSTDGRHSKSLYPEI